ncbi:hypothetical protein [Pseudodesulfovibrio mercurii]|uniref:hypothetical protein n=1 Tax=Pseudodesulfovibrio mercurii TaxID=641491 RepID=UPI00031CF199|nr:hypothetical protein [Pseudodesulfovibrio mercurii]
MGAGVSAVAFLFGLFTLIKTLFFGVDVPGYASLLIVMLFLGGIQLVGIGIIGEYVGRIFNQVKGRPNYIVKYKRGFDD